MFAVGLTVHIVNIEIFMHWSQAELPAGKTRRDKREMTFMYYGCRALFVLALLLLPAPVEAQLPSVPRAMYAEPRWWFWGGGVALGLPDIQDGNTNSTWSFGGDPLWQFRLGLERTFQDNISLGVSVAYGDVDVRVLPRSPTDPSTPASCTGFCPSRVHLTSYMATFRAGQAGRGFGSSLEGGLGFIGFSGLRTRAGEEEIRGFARSSDFTAMIGASLHYGIGNDFHITLSQDFGIGFHSKRNLPDGASSTYRPRSTRFGLRYGF